MLPDMLPSRPVSDSSPAESDPALVLVDVEGRIRRLNPAAVRIIGRPGSEVAGMPVDEVLRLSSQATPLSAPWWASLLPDTPLEVVGSGGDAPLVGRSQRLEGAGDPWCLLELRLVSPAGREAGADDAIWLDSFELAFLADLEGRFVAVSHSFARKFGRPAPAWPGGSVAALLHPEDIAVWNNALQRLCRPPHRGKLELRWHTPQGWRWLAWDLGFQGKAGGPGAVLKATGSDVTKRRLAEEQYHRLACAVEQSPVAILITDPEGGVQYVNRKFSESTGCSIEDILDRSLDPLRAGHADEEAYRKFWLTLRTTGVWRGELCLTRQGRTVWESIQVSSIRNEDGAVSNLLCLREDITARKQLEDQLRQSQKMESLGTLAGGIAHDFNNMLAIINGYTEICLSRARAQDEALRKHLREIHSAAQRACGLVRQILTFSRKTEVRFAPVSLSQLVRELAALVGETFPRTITFDLDLDESLPDLRGDQNQLQQVIMNLCVNARDAMPSGGVLTLSLRQVSGQSLERFRADPALHYAALEVSDTGIGMSPEVQARLFEPFFTTKQTSGGTGLGLAVVYGIILNHFGFIEVASTPGQGSTFRIYLPLTAAKTDQPLVPLVLGEFPPGHESVLVVEDEPSLRTLLVMVLEQKGYCVQAVGDGRAAVELLASGAATIDVMLLDFNLPSVDGIGVFKIARRVRSRMKVIVISGNLSLEAKAEFVRLGQTEFLEKPCRLEDVGQRIRQVLAPISLCA
ncbi:MAG: PAS domain S-box protein [Opitutaceae bacterium]|nr:PAS domain S-box protein [Opitutaceae bacterium]